MIVMYEIIYTGQFKKSFKLCVRRGLDVHAFTTVLDILQGERAVAQRIPSPQTDRQVQRLLGMSYTTILVAYLGTV